MSAVRKGHMYANTRKSLRYYLRYELNEDCLVELFEYLHVHDLMQICDLDTDDDHYFTVLIRARLIGRKLIDLEPRNKHQKVWSFTKTLETFGPFIKRLKIPLRSTHLNYILRKIITHSVPGALTEVQFMSLPSENYDDDENPVNEELVQQAIPYFSNIKKVLIEDEWNILSGFYTIFLNLTNLKSLKMIKVNGPRVWTELTTVDSLNLTELKVVEGGASGSGLAKFIEKLPRLEVFEWYGRRSCSEVGEALVKNCPKLRVYGEYCEDRNNDPKYYDFLGHFEHLVRATLTSRSTSACDLKSTLQILAHKNQLRQLTIYLSDAKMIESPMIDDRPFEYFNGFLCLKTVLFHFYDHSSTIDFGERQIFFRNLLTSMHGLTKITLVSGSYVFNIPKIIQFTPHIQEISINQQRLYQMPAEVRRIRRFIQQTASGRRNKVQLILNAEQAREFLVLKNIEQIATIVIKDEHEDRQHFGYTMM